MPLRPVSAVAELQLQPRKQRFHARGVVGVGGDLCAGGGVVSVHDAGVHCDDGGAAGERMWGNGEAVRGRSEGETDVLREGLEETGDSGSAGGGAERDYVRGAVL